MVVTARRGPVDDSSPERELERLDADLRRARRPALLTLPEPLRRGRVGVSSSAVVALLALAVALGCVFVVRVLWAERSAGVGEPPTTPAAGVVVSPSTPLSPAQGKPAPSDSGRTTVSPGGTDRFPSTPPAAPLVVVHVVGQVALPGLVRLPSGARVADAIAAAGGARKSADLTALNLARLVVDGEQVHVPRPGEVVSVPPLAPLRGPPGSGPSSAPPAVVDLNAADAAALDTLPGVGPVLAQRIIDWRAEHGRFSSVDELGEVSGIGEKLLANVRARVRV